MNIERSESQEERRQWLVQERDKLKKSFGDKNEDNQNEANLIKIK